MNCLLRISIFYSRLYLFSVLNHFAFYSYADHWFLAPESGHSCFLLCCWEICSWADCWLWAKAFFPFNKLSRLSSIRTTFYYYCVYDCSTWLPKALLTLSVKPGLELWALAAIPAALLLLKLEPNCCVLLSVHVRQSPRSAAQQVW